MLCCVARSEKEKEKIKKKLQANRKGGSAGTGSIAGSTGMLDKFSTKSKVRLEASFFWATIVDRFCSGQRLRRGRNGWRRTRRSSG
jgi:hypothetical protein